VVQLLLRFIHSDLYAQNRIFATTLALIGIWEQLVLCNCADRDTAVDDVAHSFTMVRRARGLCAVFPRVGGSTFTTLT
jgi:hypothetical protein